MKCLEDADQLRSRGHVVYAVAAPGTVVEERFARNRHRTYALKSAKYFAPLTTRRLAMFFKDKKIEAIHIHRTQDLGPSLLAAEWAEVRARALTLRMESAKRKFDPYHRWIYSRLTAVATITERLRKIVIENRPVAADKVHCVYNGLDLEKLKSESLSREEIRTKWNVSQNAFVIGILGRLDPLKGQSVVIEALNLLRDKIENIKLIICGSETRNEPGELNRLQLKASELHLEEAVIFTGRQSPPGIILPAFDVSIMATKKETFGNVTVESGALGLPVIGTDTGGTPEIIENGKTGFLIPPFDPEALAAKILELCQNPKLRREMGTNAAKRMREKFSMQEHVEKLESLLGVK